MEAILIAWIALIAWQRAILAGELVSRAFALDPESRDNASSNAIPTIPLASLSNQYPSSLRWYVSSNSR